MSDRNASPTTPFRLEDDDELAHFDSNGTDPTPLSDPLDQLHAAFPSQTRDAIAAVLVAADNDVSAAQRILQQSTPSSAATLPPPSSDATSSTTTTTTTTTTAAADNATSTTSDAAIAKYLQRQERLLASSGSAATAVAERPLTSIRHANIPSKPIRLPPATMAAIMESLREIVLPALRAHFEELALPNLRREAVLLAYELRGVQVIGLALGERDIFVRASPDNDLVYVNVMNCSLQLLVGEWSYRNSYINDSGKNANVAINNLNIMITLSPVKNTLFDELGNYVHVNCINIAQTQVNIEGSVRFNLNAQTMNWLYSTIVLLFKPLLVSYVKDVVNDHVSSTLIRLVRQLEDAVGLNASLATQNAPDAQQRAADTDDSATGSERDNVMHPTPTAAAQPSVPAVE